MSTDCCAADSHDRKVNMLTTETWGLICWADAAGPSVVSEGRSVCGVGALRSTVGSTEAADVSSGADELDASARGATAASDLGA